MRTAQQTPGRLNLNCRRVEQTRLAYGVLPMDAHNVFASDPEVNRHDEPAATPERLNNADAQLLANGYQVVVERGKVPVASGWNTTIVDRKSVAKDRAAFPSARNTAIRTGFTTCLVAVDNDTIG